jgi:hypothetical protein
MKSRDALKTKVAQEIAKRIPEERESKLGRLRDGFQLLRDILGLTVTVAVSYLLLLAERLLRLRKLENVS